MACEPEDKDEAITPDEGTSIEGAYLMNDYNVRIYDNGSVDTSYLVVSQPKIEFKMDKNVGTGKSRTDLRGFIEETVNEFYRTSPTGVFLTIENVDRDKMIIEKISGGKFEIKEFALDGVFSSGTNTVTYPCKFKAEGTFKQDKITLQFVLTIDTGIQSYFEGTAEGKKFNEL